MPDILHKVGLKSSSPDDVYRALTTLDGLSGWWTTTMHRDSPGECKTSKGMPWPHEIKLDRWEENLSH